MIWKNFVRDLRRTASRLISVSIITMIAVMVYTALSGILTNIERISASYLEGQNVADYWLTGVNLDQGDCRTLEGIAGVTGVQPRVVLDAEERHDSSVTLQLYAVPGDYAINTPYVVEGRLPESLQLYAVPGDYAINTPYVVEGRLPESSREIVLSDTLARARGLHPGDWYELTLTGTGRYLRVRISGLVKDPECLYYVNTTTPAPDLTHYAFAYGNETLLQELMGANRYNQICITTDGSLSAARLRLAVDAALGDRVVNILSLEDNTQAYYLLEMRDNLAPILNIFPVLFFLCAVLMMVSTMNRLIENARSDIGTFKALGYSDAKLAPILNIFPVLFFLCAVLMMVSTMNRLIENARSDIGTFKALGYSDAKIMCYYLLHALLVVLVGFPVGAWLGRYVSALIVSTIAIGCDLPPYTVVHDFAAWGRALGLTALCCIGSAWLVARSLLKETPAQCMRPKPPRSTKPVALERLGPVWHRLGFNQKYIIRNTLRNKVRMATCIFGIAFCMALVFLAFALRDSIQAYSDALAERQNRYDLMVDLSTSVTEGQYRRLTNDVGVTEAELEMSTACWLYTDSQRATAALTVTEDQVSLKRYDPYAEGALTLPGNGLVLEESLANELGLRAGDRVTLRFAGDSRYYSVPVAEVNRCVSGVCLSRSLWRGLGLAYTPTAAYLTSDGPEALAERLGDYDFVDAWQTRQAATAAAVERLSSMSMVVYILILFGGGLACIVIYNLGIMSFFEQLRSLATLMVLGFYEKEIKTLQLSENIIFAVCGILLGIPLGVSLNRMILASITTMPLMEATRPASLALSCAVTLLFALAVNVVIGRKMREIDMLGALSITTMPLMEATRPASLALSCAVTLLFALAVNVVIGRKMREIDMLGALKSVE